MRLEEQRELDQIFDQLSPLQISWVAARAVSKTDKEASKAVGINDKTPYMKWRATKPLIDRAVAIIQRDHARMAMVNMERMLPDALKALEKKIQGRNPSIAAIKMFIDRFVPEVQQHHIDADVTIFDVDDWKASRKARLAEILDTDETGDG